MITTEISISGYKVSEKLYDGSRTLVYRGCREVDQKPVVIKLLKNPYPSFSELVQFRNQYTIAKNLSLPGIIETYSLEAYQNGYALVMEDFGGISLKEWRGMGESSQTLVEFLQIAISLCNTLDILICNRIIHKDIKPANILINPETKQVKLIDFSIASLLPREIQTLRHPNVLEGTLGYLSPEQTGRMNRGIDYRTDFYSLGVTFYELLTGELPFQSDDAMELVHCHIAKEPPWAGSKGKEIPQVLGDIVMKLMAKNAEDRYQSALGLKYDLEICLCQLKETGKIESFLIGQRDVCDRFIIPEKLYGREKEVEQLLEAFGRVSQGSSTLMLVAGFSGIGKTALVNEVHKPIVKGRGYFIKGKFDQFNRNIPFSAFVQAFRNLMGQLLSESDVQLQEWKNKILQVLGDNGQVIIDVIPELEQIIGKQPPFSELSGTAAQNRFNLLFQKFLQVFTTKEHPLVIFLDDLQWADLASLRLMQLLMGESESGYLLIIGAYRDNEVSAAHPLMLTLEEISKANAKTSTITLAPLSETSLNELVADTLSCSPEIAKQLTQLIYQKTQGNPFFSTQFLKSLHEDKLIIFDPPQRGWVCNITEVKALALTDDVVEFMALQLQKLPEATQKILKLAACIGNQFDLGTLAIVSEKSETETATNLWKALQEGLILPINEVYKFYVGRETQELATSSLRVTYKFLHDRVQQAAYSLIPETDRAITHLLIGQLLLQQISPAAREERIFELVNQLNYGISLITDLTERDNLAQLNLTACRKARGATAYQAALSYATAGLQLLGASSWQRQYGLTLALHELAAEVAWLCGEFERMEQWIEAVQEATQTPLEQVNVYQIKIQALASQNNLRAALATGQAVLNMLGVRLPDSPTGDDVQHAMQEIVALIGERPVEELFHLPKMVDAQQIAILQITASIIPACYITNLPLYPLVVALLVKRSIQFGNSPVSALGYAVYGVVLNAVCRDVGLADEFGRLAYRLALEPDAKSFRAPALVAIGTFIHHRKSHLRETLSILQEGYRASVETGALDQAGYSGNTFCWNAFWCGQPLAELEPQLRAYRQQLLDFNQQTTSNYCSIYWETALMLLDPPFYQALSARSEELVSHKLALSDLFWVYGFYLHQFTISFLLGDVTQADHQATQARCYLKAATSTIGEVVFYFYDSLTALATVAPDSSEVFSQRQRVQDNQVQLQHWADHAPMNHLHKYQLVAAEQCRVLDKKSEAIDLYDCAISGAKENGYIQEEALSNELAAKFYLDWGKEKVAQTYMQEAYYCYARWGAKAKIDDLEKRYPQLLKPILQQKQLSFNSLESITKRTINFSTQTSNSSTNVCAALDFATILKATQALSSEIQLEKLLSTLMQVVMENAGAEKAALLQIKNDTLMLEAIATIFEGASLPSVPYERGVDIPTTVINYVKRSLKTVVLDDATAENDFIADPYLIQSQPKSVLCTPILNQGQLIGLLYLENNLTIGAFTPECLEVIQILCTQAAISLENARLYQQAQQAQLQIVQSEKMSALGNLVAGVAHEMNNPLGFIAATLKQTKPTVSDIKEHLKLYQKHFMNPVEEIIDHAEEIDLDYSLEDLPKMIDTMVMACDRLKNISTSLRTFSRADKDYKVAFNIHEGIDSTILILKHRLKANEQRPEIQVATKYGSIPQIQCFPGQLNQVFMNILANAIDALDESNSKRSFAEIQANPNLITITTSMEDNQVKINIADNGKGMTQEVKQKIFDHLFTTKGVGKGTGLGLAIAKQIVEETHGGKLSCNSVIGEGTEFIIEIPM